MAKIEGSAVAEASLWETVTDGVALKTDDELLLRRNLRLTSTNAIQFRWIELTDVSSGAINSTTVGQLDIDGDDEVEITSPIIDLNASTGLALDGANLNSAWTVNTTNKIQFRDTGLFINSSADGQLDIDADVKLEITAPTTAFIGNMSLDGDLDFVGAQTIGGTARLFINPNGELILGSAETDKIKLGRTSGVMDCEVVANTKFTFRDNAIFIRSEADGDLTITADGNTKITGVKIIMANLATSDPSVAGQLWNNSGVMNISAG